MSADLLRRIVTLVEAAGIPYMVAGSFASTHHGAPRATQDIDVVIDPTADALDALLASLSDVEYYVDPDTARDALRRRSQFNVIDIATGWKVDLVIRKDRAFSIEELRRRERATMLGVDVYVATAEDAILSKLEWAKRGDSERQLRDVAGMIAVCGSSLDTAYIEEWVDPIGVRAQWDRVRGG
jgi:hypothetical protein